MNAQRSTRAPSHGWARARAPGQRRPALEVFPEHRVPIRRALRRSRRSVPPARPSRPGKRISAALWLLARFSAMDRSAPEFGRVAKCDRSHKSQSCDRLSGARPKCPFCRKRPKCYFRAKCPIPSREAFCTEMSDLCRMSELPVLPEMFPAGHDSRAGGNSFAAVMQPRETKIFR